MSREEVRWILASEEEYAEEAAEVSRLEAQLTELRSHWLEKTRGLIVVSPEEYRREEAEVKHLEETLRRAWSRWGHYMWERRHSLRRVREIREELARAVTPEMRVRLLSELETWERRAAAYLGLIRSTMDEITGLRRKLREETAALSRKVIATPELITIRRRIEETEERLEHERERLTRKVIAYKLRALVDSMTGYLIVYLDREIEGYRCWLLDEKTSELIEPVTAIKIEKTISFETDGHETLIAEITGYTIIPCDMIFKVEDITSKMRKKIIEWWTEQCVNYTKKGEAVKPSFKESSFVEDFKIQKEKEGAKYEMEIYEWFKTVTGEWAERTVPALKEGFGAYATDEPPLYPEMKLYVEYAHEEEPIGTHPPREGVEAIA